MTTYFITRHKGALDWARAQGIEADPLDHFDPATTAPGDTVIGTLPVHIIAEICTRGGRYLHLVMDVPPEARGKELSAEDMTRFGARLEEYDVIRKGE